MKKSTLFIIITVAIINVVAYIYEVKFNTCSETSWAGAERIIEVCTQATVALSDRHDELSKKQQKISTQANGYRNIRDKVVSNINDKIKQDVVFQKRQK